MLYHMLIYFNLYFVGKRAFIAGVADDQGFGWAIAKALAAAGAEILVGTWVPVSYFNLVEFDYSSPLELPLLGYYDKFNLIEPLFGQCRLLTSSRPVSGEASSTSPGSKCLRNLA